MGKDSSGNGNNWTPNNISVTSDHTNDSMLDTPSNNFANLNNTNFFKIDLGTGINQTKNERNNYFYDGEEIIFYGSKTSTEFKDIKRSRFNSDALFTTTMEPYAKNGGIVNSYQKGYSVQQYWPYRIGAD